jgi:hypothetical protein
MTELMFLTLAGVVGAVAYRIVRSVIRKFAAPRAAALLTAIVVGLLGLPLGAIGVAWFRLPRIIGFPRPRLPMGTIWVPWMAVVVIALIIDTASAPRVDE